MTSTKLLGQLLISADALQRDYGMENQYPAFYILAAMYFCKRDYMGFSEVEETQPLPYEEERLRYMFGKTFIRSPRASSRYMEIFLKRNKEDFAPTVHRDVLLRRVAVMAENRKIPVISADLMLAAALEHLNPQFGKLLLPQWRGGRICAAELAAEADREIYDYVIDQIAALTEKLRQKAEGARELRDWRPALAFAPAEVLEEKLKASVEVEERDGRLHLTYPYFFADTGNPLHLTVWETEGSFVVCDNGCAVAELKAHLQGKGWKQIARRICAGTICQIEDECITACCSAPHDVQHYQQYLSLIAHADLYPEYDPRGNIYEVRENYLALPLNADADYSAIRECVIQYRSVGYDEYKGLLMGLGVVYLGNSTGAKYLLTTDADGLVTIHDHSNSYHEGAIFERYLWEYDDLTLCQAQVEALARRFDGHCDGKEVTCTFRNDSEDAFVRAVNRFAQMAVILAQLGDNIPLKFKKHES